MSRRRFTYTAEAQALAKLEDKFGRIDPEDLVAAARDPAHAHHDKFDWNDASAAHTARIETARAIIRSYFQISIEHAVLCAPKAPCYLPDPERSGESCYRRLDRIKKNEHKRAVLLEELARILGCINRAEAIAVALCLGDYAAGLQRAREVLRDLA